MEELRYKFTIQRDSVNSVTQCIFYFKIYSITLDPDPNWAKVLDPDPNSMYLDPQHWR